MKQEELDKIFNILRKIHNSHWKTPKTEEITENYTFTIGKGKWIAKITFNPLEYTVNQELTPRLKDMAEKQKQEFISQYKPEQK